MSIEFMIIGFVIGFVISFIIARRKKETYYNNSYTRAIEKDLKKYK